MFKKILPFLISVILIFVSVVPASASVSSPVQITNNGQTFYTPDSNYVYFIIYRNPSSNQDYVLYGTTSDFTTNIFLTFYTTTSYDRAYKYVYDGLTEFGGSKNGAVYSYCESNYTHDIDNLSVTPTTDPAEEEEESGWFAAFREKLKTWFDNVITGLASLGDRIVEWFEKVKTAITDFSDNVKTWFSDLGTSIVEWFSKVWDSIKNIGTTIGDFFKDIWTGFKTAVVSLFVPDEGVIDAKIEAFRADLPFIDAILDFGSNLGSLFNSSAYSDDVNFPTISIDLSAAESQYNWGTTAIAIDFSWYARYKPYVDMFISAFLLMAYFWLLYKRLPDIISGAGMITESNAYYDKFRRDTEIKEQNRLDKQQRYDAKSDADRIVSDADVHFRQEQWNKEIQDMHDEGWF